MIKMGKLRDIGKYRIPFHYNDQHVVLKITKYTTSDDVVEMLLRNSNMTSPTATYGLYEVEKTSALERQIPGRNLVVKVWRSWGCEREHLEFVVKRKEAVSNGNTGLRLKNHTPEGSIDALFRKSYLATDSYLDNSRATVSGNDTVLGSTKCCEIELEVNETPSAHKARGNTGKSFVLAKFFNDLVKSDKGRKITRSRKHVMTSAARRRGDGTERPIEDSLRHADGSEDADLTFPSMLHERCQYFWDRYNTSDTESESSGEFSLEDDEVTWCDSDGRHGNSNVTHLNTAFIKPARNYDSDEGIDVTSVSSVDLDAAFVCDPDLSRQRSISTFSHDLCSVGVDEFEANISCNEYLQELFGGHGNGCSDDDVDSFMRSTLDDSFSS